MGRGVGTFLNSMTFRLLAYLLPTIGAVTLVYALVSFHTTRVQLTQQAENGALRTSELIKSATHYGMLLNRKEDVHHTIRQLARSPGVAGIRVYDKEGSIIFSANADEIGRQVNLRAEACVNCHAQGLSVPTTEPERRFRQFQAGDDERILGLINPIRNEPLCSSAPCHAHPADQTILGVLDVQMSMAFMERAIDTARSQLIWAGLAMLVIVALGTAAFIYRVVRRPVSLIYEGTERVAAGDFGTRIEVGAVDELGRLAEAFNRMTEDLRLARGKLTGWSETLEDEVAKKTEELRSAQKQVLHMEKMASLGKLSATVAHELNNPLAGILTYARLIERDLEQESLTAEERSELCRYVGLVKSESARCGDIVRNLLLFARRSGTKLARHSLNEIVSRSLMLVQHHLQMSDIGLHEELLEGDDTIVCDEGKIQQAFVALMVNAVEAMHDQTGGTLTVRVFESGEVINVDIGDTGVGIPESVRDHIFEPFFSTKESESGVGLGLAVVYGIVQQHGYRIEVESEVNEGTVFHLHLTRSPSGPAGDGPGETGYAGGVSSGGAGHEG